MYISRVVPFCLISVGNIIKISFPLKLICVCVCWGAIDKHKSSMLIKIYSMPVSGKYYWEKIKQRVLVKFLCLGNNQQMQQMLCLFVFVFFFFPQRND